MVRCFFFFAWQLLQCRMRAEPRVGSGVKAPLAQRDRRLIFILISLCFLHHCCRTCYSFYLVWLCNGRSAPVWSPKRCCCCGPRRWTCMVCIPQVRRGKLTTGRKSRPSKAKRQREKEWKINLLASSNLSPFFLFLSALVLLRFHLFIEGRRLSLSLCSGCSSCAQYL